MNWFTVLKLGFQVLAALGLWLRDKGLISKTQAALLGDVLEAQAYEVELGRAARLAQREHDSRGVSDDEPDPFRRD